MDAYLCLAAGKMVWVSLPFLVVVTACRFYRWFTVPRSAMRLGLLGPNDAGSAKLLKLTRDSFLFPQVLELDRYMWWFVIAMHVAGIALFIGHLNLVSEFTFLSRALGDRGMERFALWSGGAIAVVLLITLPYFLVRRLTLPGRSISVPGDYFLLALLLLLIVTGSQMRFFSDAPTSAYREYVQSLLSFEPRIPSTLDAGAARWVLGSHVALANVLMLYFPMSKLMHFIGSFTTNLIRNEHLWMKGYNSP